MRRITFKKKRIGLVKKLMQLSLISGCDISLQIFNKEDGIVLEYTSYKKQEMKKKELVLQHVKFSNENYELCQHID